MKQDNHQDPLSERLPLSAFVAATPDAMIVLDEDFRILGINPAVTTTFGWSPQDAVGRSCTEFLCCRNLNRTELCGTSGCPLTRVLSLQQPLPNEELIIGSVGTGDGAVGSGPAPLVLPEHPGLAAQQATPSGGRRGQDGSVPVSVLGEVAIPVYNPGREVSVSVTPLVGDSTSVVFTLRDLTSLKLMNSLRSNFVSMVSHELRTPLNAVNGFVDLLLQGHMGTLTDEQHKYLGYAQEGVQQLISIVEDILFLTRSDSGQFEVKPEAVNLLTLIRQVIRGLLLQARKADVVLHREVPAPSPMLYVDPQRMKQVLNNLLTNAIKYTPPGGTVTIRALPYDERFIMITVSDTGSGIRVEDRPHIFQRFYQSNHSQQSKVGGYGLGLPIAKLIVEQHGGNIDFETTLGKGSTFYFTAPLLIHDAFATTDAASVP